MNHSAPRAARLALASALIAAPLLWLAAEAVSPKLAADSSEQLTIIGQHPDRWYTYTLLLIVGTAVVKPVSFEKLGTVLERWTAHTPAGIGWRARAESGEVLDLDRILMLEELRPGEHSLFAQFVDSFAVRAPQDAAAIHAALEAGDANRVTQAAHLLKGSSQNLGAAAVGRLCARLEDAARKEDLDSAREVADELDELLGTAVRALRDRVAIHGRAG